MTGPVVQARIVLALDHSLTVLSAGAGIKELLGFSHEDFNNSKVKLQDLIHKDDSDVAALLFSAENRGQSGALDFRLRHADGKVRCICGQYKRKIAECNGGETVELWLQDAKSWFASHGAPQVLTQLSPTMEIVLDALYFKNRNHVFTAANHVMCATFPSVGGNIVGLTDYDLFPEKDADFFYALEKQVFTGIATSGAERAFVSEGGKLCWIDNLKYPVRDPNGEVIGLFGVARDETLRRNLVEKIRESEELLREAQTIAGIGSYITDIKNWSWSGSEVMDQIFGIGKDYSRTVEGWSLLVHPDERESMISYFVNEVVGQRRKFDREYRIVRPADQAVRWVHGLGRLEFNEQDEPVRMVGTIQDITERRIADQALRESRELQQLFIEHAPAALAMLDREMRYLAVSHRWLDMHSLLGQELVGRSHYEVFPGREEHWKQDHRRALAGEVLPTSEKLLKRADGSTQWIKRRIQPWRTADGNVGGILIFSEDVTRQKETEDRLRLAASVFTHAREGILITDPSGSILEVNEMFTRITGYPREEVLGKNPRILKSGLHGSEFYMNLWRTLTTEGHWSGELWNRNKSGDIYAEMKTITCVRDEQGKPLRYVALFSDITQIKKHAQQLEHVTHYDQLTNLPNRTLLADRLQQAMAQANRRNQTVAVAYLDLDGFKSINDQHGHDVGDRLLTALAFDMKCALREGDTLSRIGGDEFVAVMLDLDDARASEPLLAQLRDAATERVQIGKLALRVSASIGVTFYPQPHESDSDLLLRQADQAMYQAKLAGGNRYHIFDPDYDQSVRGHHENLERIRVALEAKEFVLYYQPKVNMRTGDVIGVEALIRWQHPERGLLPPGMFLPVIEEQPLAIEVGEWVIESALSQIEIWSQAGLHVPISVNVGALQLQQPDFVERLTSLLAAHPRVKPFSLELEVLETSALQNVVKTSEVLNACDAIGVTIALDDFGTGYSSLTYLKRLPASMLKIDQSFVSDMLDDLENLNILEGILGLASAFHRKVIAEGVETVEHGTMLLQLGCELGQGYGIARPMPAQELPGWISAWRPDARWVQIPAVHSGNRAVLYASVAHRAWFAAFETFIEGNRQSPPPLNPRLCRFGMWLESEREAGRANIPGFRALDELHQKLHDAAGKILTAREQSNNNSSQADLSGLRAIHDQLCETLETFSKD